MTAIGKPAIRRGHLMGARRLCSGVHRTAGEDPLARWGLRHTRAASRPRAVPSTRPERRLERTTRKHVRTPRRRDREPLDGNCDPHGRRRLRPPLHLRARPGLAARLRRPGAVLPSGGAAHRRRRRPGEQTEVNGIPYGAGYDYPQGPIPSSHGDRIFQSRVDGGAIATDSPAVARTTSTPAGRNAGPS